MITYLYHLIHKPVPRIKRKTISSIRHMLAKLLIILLPFPLLMLIMGIDGIIQQESPEQLATFTSMGTAFFSLLEMHTLIIAGALGITFIIWLLTRNIWSRTEEEKNKKSSEENQRSVKQVHRRVL